MSTTFIEHISIRGFRSLADVELSEIPKAAVLIGANALANPISSASSRC